MSVRIDRKHRVAVARCLPLFAGVLLLLAAGACSGDGAPGSGTAVVTDSAGIRVVDNAGSGSWTADEVWRFEEELRIGVESGDPELQFGNIVGIDVDSEGQIVAYDGQARRVRVFAPDGTLETAFGRAGGGPGELGSASVQPPSGLFVDAQDAVAVPDLLNQRLARFDLEGNPLESPTLAMDQGIPMMWARDDQRRIYQQFRRMDMTGASGLEGMIDEIVRLGPAGSEGETVHTLDAGQTVSMGAGGMPEIRIFAPEPVWAVLGDGRLVTGMSSEYRLELRDPAGEIETLIRREGERRPVTESDRQALLEVFETAWEEAGVPAEMAGPLMNAIQFEEEWPVLARIMGGPEGTTWVQRVEADPDSDALTAEALQAGDFGSPLWDVFDRDGVFLGAVELPERFVPFRFVDEMLYGVGRDELGVQRIVRLRLVRDPS